MLEVRHIGLKGRIKRLLLYWRAASSALVLPRRISLWNPFPAAIWCRAWNGFIWVHKLLLLLYYVRVLRRYLCHFFLGFVFFSRIVDISREDFYPRPYSLELFQCLCRAVACLRHLIDLYALLLGQSSQSRMLTQVFRRAMVMFRILSRNLPNSILPYNGQHSKRAAEQSTVTPFPFPLLRRQVPAVLILAPSVTFQPQPVEARACNDDSIPLLGGPLFGRLEQFFAAVELTRWHGGH